MKNRVIVALDVDSHAQAVRLAESISPIFPFFKIGIKLFTQAGPDFVRAVRKYGEIFLDLKFYDIPSIAADAVEQAVKMDVSLLTLHASGGSEMMQLARDRVNRLQSGVRLLGVTVLTSFDDLAEFGIQTRVEEQVRRLADLAQRSSLHGIVCSPAELGALRRSFPESFLFVTPGIRGAEDEKGDQKRTASAAEAFRAGASYVVIGRPIIAAPDPVKAAEHLAESLK